jgi:hypothetical protein
MSDDFEREKALEIKPGRSHLQVIDWTRQQTTHKRRETTMSGINSRVTAFAIILSLGFASMDTAPALADVQRHVAHQPVRPSHAGSIASSHQVAEWRTGPNQQFARSVGAPSCDLPSSGCSDNERITN